MRPGAERRPRRRGGFTLVEMVVVVAVVGLAAGIVLPRLGTGTLAVRAAADRLAMRLSEARERAILDGRGVRVDLGALVPASVHIEALDLGGTPVAVRALALAPDGDALPARATLVDAAGARAEVVLPAGFAPAHVRDASVLAPSPEGER
jgi:type II secretion system protein H